MPRTFGLDLLAFSKNVDIVDKEVLDKAQECVESFLKENLSAVSFGFLMPEARPGNDGDAEERLTARFWGIKGQAWGRKTGRPWVGHTGYVHDTKKGVWVVATDKEKLDRNTEYADLLGGSSSEIPRFLKNHAGPPEVLTSIVLPVNEAVFNIESEVIVTPSDELINELKSIAESVYILVDRHESWNRTHEDSMASLRDLEKTTRELPSPQVSHSPMVAGKPSVLVFAALEEELEYLWDEPKFKWSEPEPTGAGGVYRTCTVEDRQLIAASAPKMGLTHTAATVSALCQKWHPRLAFLIGVCAGRKDKGVGLGDIVVAELAYHFQYGSYENGELHGQLVVENVNSELLQTAKDYLSKESNLNNIRSSFPRGGNRPDGALKFHAGPMACSDLVVMDKEKFGEATKVDRKVVALEMESYAFLLSARLSHVTRALVLKSVVDFADAKKNDDFREYAKYTSTKAMLGLLDKISI